MDERLPSWIHIDCQSKYNDDKEEEEENHNNDQADSEEEEEKDETTVLLPPPTKKTTSRTTLTIPTTDSSPSSRSIPALLCTSPCLASPQQQRRRQPPPSSRKRQSSSPGSLLRDDKSQPLLLTLARSHQWPDVLQRCRTHPSEAEPRPCHVRHNNFLCSRHPSSSSSSSMSPRVYHETALGVLCASDWSLLLLLTNANNNNNHTTSVVMEWLDVLCEAAPHQLPAPQQRHGHTPLRAALKNPTCPLAVLQRLVQADINLWCRSTTEKERDECASSSTSPTTTNQTTMTTLAAARDWTPAVCQPDDDGLFPMDHLIQSIQVGIWQQQQQPREKQQQPQTNVDKTERWVQLLIQMQDFYTKVVETTATAKDNSFGIAVYPTCVSPPRQRTKWMKQDDEEWPTCLSPPDPSCAPLIQLFSLGTSFGILSAARTLIPPGGDALDETINAPRLERIFRTTRRLLEWNPRLIYHMSSTTGCSPLHVALRNYGNQTLLIRELLYYDTDRNDGGGYGRLVTHRNRYGDLPLHVACAVGVPLNILRLVLVRTLQASQPGQHYYETTPDDGYSMLTYAGHPNPMIWSRNRAGYTPVDLEWIRHVEQGNGFCSQRAFYPLDAFYMGKPSARDAELYECLLKQAVDQVMAGSTRKKPWEKQKLAADEEQPMVVTNQQQQFASENVSDCAMDTNRAFGLLLHRIFLVIRVAFSDSFSRSPMDLSGDMLHLAAALSGPVGPTLPRPILELVRWHDPGQLDRPDHVGRLPLHYSLGAAQWSAARRRHIMAMSRSGTGGTTITPMHLVQHPPSPPPPPPAAAAAAATTTTTEAIHCVPSGYYPSEDYQENKVGNTEWSRWVQDIIQAEPSACQVVDHYGRLPLHYALDGPVTPKCDASSSMHEILTLMLDSYPESVDAYDPVLQLYPFMMAASHHDDASLDWIYKLLRRSPGVLKTCCVQQNDDPQDDGSSRWPG